MLFSLILSGLMSLLVSGIATFRAVGFADGLPGLWASASADGVAVRLSRRDAGGTAGAAPRALAVDSLMRTVDAG